MAAFRYVTSLRGCPDLTYTYSSSSSISPSSSSSSSTSLSRLHGAVYHDVWRDGDVVRVGCEEGRWLWTLRCSHETNTWIGQLGNCTTVVAGDDDVGGGEGGGDCDYNDDHDGVGSDDAGDDNVIHLKCFPDLVNNPTLSTDRFYQKPTFISKQAIVSQAVQFTNMQQLEHRYMTVILPCKFCNKVWTLAGRSLYFQCHAHQREVLVTDTHCEDDCFHVASDCKNNFVKPILISATLCKRSFLMTTKFHYIKLCKLL
ncbi:hypothetical protein HELRODRAFT_179486 [Helobdella robusta]|uniref:Uncharacterized protein n=1 Tax=Helobdella robusta TaxID=6412 RepID=T1FES6_HELRO|nr:hypothetical protein HELRODRAFT_179486 [Helobdella robusta]ESN95412.1 hypothetical protein HELRODRAFT_179486 [Helobdella robusta]